MTVQEVTVVMMHISIKVYLFVKMRMTSCFVNHSLKCGRKK